MPSPPPRSKGTRFGFWPVPLLCLLLAIQISITVGAGKPDDLSWFDPLIDVRAMVMQDHVGEPDPAAMQEAAINAMLETLDDPYTVWIPPRMEGEFDKQMRGSYVGIGAEIDLQHDRLRIVSPLEDSPALEAGVRAGDIVLEIDGTDTLGLGTDRCIELLMGEEGDPVDVLVRHLDGTEEVVTIVRRRIETRSVRGVRRDGTGWDHMLDPENGIGYIRLTQFTDRSVEEMRTALDRLEAAGAGSLVLDLRFNGGGTLDGAIDIADLFLDRGVIVSVKDRNGRGRSWTADDDEDDRDWPMVVLVNDGSASASEIVSGALQSLGRAKVLGERTFGKGSVQEVRMLPGDQGILKMTTARYYLPDGRSLDRHGEAEIWGVDPDPGYLIDLDPDDYVELIERRRAYEPIGGEENEQPARVADATWVEETLGDPQLAGAIVALQARERGDAWPRIGGDPSAALVRAGELKTQLDYRDRLREELSSVEDRIRRLEAGEDPDSSSADSSSVEPSTEEETTP
ncbi:MAG: S41 family peptidase [Planctomycetota bacterium]|nr:S41 family peptidase [Planctomycetota bacterium]